jgi:diamine N-acetyltransferase
MSKPIELREIDSVNHVEIRALAVRADQERFVASVDRSLADAYVWQESLFRAAYLDGCPVGFVLVFPFEAAGESDLGSKYIVNIVRLMIDAQQQGKGIGRALLNAVVSWVLGFEPRPEMIRISTLPDNGVALALYKSAGFVERGFEDGEVVLYRDAGGTH